MPEVCDIRTLIHLAAEGIAPVIAGCAEILNADALPTTSSQPGQNVARTTAAMSVKPITYFGPPIVHRWRDALGAKSPPQQLEALARLATLSAAECQEEAAPVVGCLATQASGEDRAVAIEYLKAIPLAVRRSLVADPSTGNMTVPFTLGPDDDRSLFQLLPTDVPPFAVGSDLPGTSYRLEELLGMGGFGAVYKARNRFEQNQPPRAIKFCLDTSMVATLHRERAILDHLMAVGGTKGSNRIVRLYGYALEAEPPFLVYEYVPGGDLTCHLAMTRQRAGRGLLPPEALEVIRQLAEALAFAHAEGLVHRDLKPANVLMSGDTVKLTDFGIGGAVASQAMRGAGMTASVMSQASAADHAHLFRGSGTPLYMSPEQRRGDHPDPRHDLYSLGVMWYQLLVGDVTRELHPGWPDELMEEFQTPREHIQVIERCVGYYKKRAAHGSELLALLEPATSGRASATVCLSTADTKCLDVRALSGKFAREAEFERLKHLLAEQIDQDALHQAHETVAALLRIRPDDPEVLDVLAFLDKRLAVPISAIHAFAGHGGWVRSVAFVPGGLHALSAGDDRTLRLWDLDNKYELHRFTGHTGAIMSVAVSGDGRLAASASWDGTVRIWDMNTGQELRRFAGNWKAVKTVALSPDGRIVLFGSDDNLIHLWDVNGSRELLRLAGHTDLVHCLVIAPNGRGAVSGSDDSTIRQWDLASGKELRRFLGHADTVTSLAFAPDGKLLLSGSSDNTARLWQVEDGREVRRLAGHSNWVNGVAFLAGGRQALTGSGGEIVKGQFQDGNDITVRLWDVPTGKELARYEGHQAPVTGIAAGSVGRLVISGSLDKTVRLLLLPD